MLMPFMKESSDEDLQQQLLKVSDFLQILQNTLVGQVKSSGGTTHVQKQEMTIDKVTKETKKKVPQELKHPQRVKQK